MPARQKRTVTRTLADGSTKAYTYEVKPAVKRRVSRYEPESVGALMLAWQSSPEWAALAKATKTTHSVYLRELFRLKDQAAKAITRKMLLAIRDAIAVKRGNGAGTGFARAASCLFAWGVSRDWLAHNPMTGARPLPGGTLPAWTEAEARLAMERLPEPERRAVVLAYHIGQRRGDLIKLPWSAYDGLTIRLRQEKTGVSLVLPVHPELKLELDRWSADKSSPLILTAARGGAWSGVLLSHALPTALTKIGIVRTLGIHGLRKLAATRLAEAGCSAHEISSITGHRSLSMVEHYTRTADQERLASAAIVRLQTKPETRKRRTSR